MKATVIVSDIQAPLHDTHLVERFTDFLADYQPERIVFVGDVSDSTEVARWSRGYAAEHGPLDKALGAVHTILKDIREACPSALIQIERSNHDDRTATYVKQYAPALASLGIDFATLVGLDELGITFHRSAIPIAPGWVVLHGDEHGLSQEAGRTALNSAKKVGKSVACGHTHRMGLLHYTTAVAGKVTGSLWGMEVGHMMDLRKASYLKSGGANWQQGFGLLYVVGTTVTPQLVPVGRDGSFMVEGKRYR